MEITKDVVIGDLLRMDPSVAPLLINAGMHCLGCPASQGESIELACMVHGIDADALVEELNEYLADK